MSNAIRVLVADDHLVVREGLRLMIETAADLALIGAAADGVTAVQLVGELQPDVVLMDLRMPAMDGITAVERIRERWPQVAMVILTTYNEDDLMVRGLRAGACGYLLKDTTMETLFDTIRAAARGEILMQPAIMARILHHFTDSLSSSSGSDQRLTEREREVLVRVATGERSKEIAARLGISERTVRAHLTNIYTKLGVDSRASAVAVAMQQHLLPPSMG